MAQSTKKIDIIIIVVEINYTCSNLKNSIKKKIVDKLLMNK